MTVLKFGGTSLGTPERVKKVIEIILHARRESQARAVVCSAFGGATDALITMARAAAKGQAYTSELEDFEQRHQTALKFLVANASGTQVEEDVQTMLVDLTNVLRGVSLTRELTRRTLDFIMSFGERLSARILTAAIASETQDVAFLDARELITTDARFGAAQVNLQATESQIRAHFAANSALQIVTGFIAYAPSRETTTLGRGGSDFTVSLLGAALGSEEIQIWTDVDGVLSADPRRVPQAATISEMSYEEAMEMAHFGAKVIYPPTMAPALAAGVPIRIKNTFLPQSPGTLIAGGPPAVQGPITGISSIDRVAMVQIRGCGLIGVAGTCNRLFGALAQAKINVILISQGSSEHSICFVVAPADAEPAKKIIDQAFALEILKGQLEPVIVEKDLAVVAVVGEGMRNLPGVAGRVFAAMGDNGVNVVAIAQGSSELNISFVIHQRALHTALKGLHDAFFSNSGNRPHLFMIGLGLIGNELLNQIANDLDGAEKPVVVGLANSRKMYFDAAGIKPDECLALLTAAETKASIEAFFEAMITMPVGHKVLVDCTANLQVTELYEKALSKGIRVVTPNKKACADDQTRYDRLMKLAARNSNGFRYEAVVCAGLPVIGQLKQMIASGDTLLNIEAILSGSLSFILNTVSAEVSFSQAVRQAKELGYTEPDPSDDLGGMDVARKLLILARHGGYRLELEDIQVESLLPDACQVAKTEDAFWAGLADHDAVFEKRRAEAATQGQRLRYIAQFSDGKARIALMAVGSDHPCYQMEGADNLVSLTTTRYRERPLVIKGPGAGAAVTAAQVLADILAG